MITKITSQSQLDNLFSGNSYIVADFYADWCGPCKMIAPVFEQLAKEHHKPGRIQFVKVDVDATGDIAKKYGVAAMPTFLIFKSGSVSTTLRGADVNGLRSAVVKAANDAARAPARQSTSFQTKGYTLGSADAASNRGAGSGMPVLNLNGFIGSLTRFVALYVTTLFSLDAKAAAEQSSWAVGSRR